MRNWSKSVGKHGQSPIPVRCQFLSCCQHSSERRFEKSLSTFVKSNTVSCNWLDKMDNLIFCLNCRLLWYSFTNPSCKFAQEIHFSFREVSFSCLEFLLWLAWPTCPMKRPQYSQRSSFEVIGILHKTSSPLGFVTVLYSHPFPIQTYTTCHKLGTLFTACKLDHKGSWLL